MAESIVMRAAVLVLALALAPRWAAAHVAASVDDNNRYLKLTPARDQLRLAYTVFYGEVPGAAARPAIDANRDGSIAEAEASAFAERLASEVGAGLTVTVDGVPTKVTWARVAVGMGTPSTSGGSFSIDLIAYFCFSGGGKHRFTLRDTLELPRPGETEVHIEDITGISVDHARIGPITDPENDFRFAGAGGPLADAGLDLALTVSSAAKPGTSPTCAPAASSSRPLLVALAATLALAALAALLIWRHRRPKSPR